jgi:hypothetical protein
MLKIIEANCETGEVIEREMTEADRALYDAMVAEPEVAAPETQAEAKASALAKLSALGLTEDEVNALLNK